MGHHKRIIVLLLACATQCLNGQPYNVREDPIGLSNCDTKMSIQPYQDPAVIGRGDPGAPCTGLLYYEGQLGIRRQLCGYRESFNEASAQRLCHTLGLNVDRASGSSPGVRLYRCDAYAEGGAPVPVKGSDYVNEVFISMLNEKRCNPSVDVTSHDCFDDCYFGDAAGSSVIDTLQNSCADSQEPFWGIVCTDINECLSGTLVDCTGSFDESCTLRQACGPNTTCTNLPGSYTCDCKAGYEPAGSDVKAPYSLTTGCVDIDECQPENEMPCGPTGLCQNTAGSYICMCPMGQFWSDNTKMCSGSLCPTPRPDGNATISYFGSPIDEATYTCRSGFRARQGATSYINKCINDVWENNGVCTDVDECRPSQCDQNAVCMNNVGSFRCDCNVGYVGNGLTCTEIDPCDDFSICENGDCIVEDGEPKCSCDNGYEGAACDQPIISRALIVAIVALVIGGILVVIVIVYIVSRQGSPPIGEMSPGEYGGFPQMVPTRKPFGFPPMPPALAGRGPWPSMY